VIAYLWVALGGAIGSMARYGLGLAAARTWGDAFPWGTLAINVAGSFVIGCFGALSLPDGVLPASPNIRLFVLVGICGGFTTFSSFSLQTFELARSGNGLGAAANVLLSVALCLAAVALGQAAGQRAWTARAAILARPSPVVAVLDRADTAAPVLAAAALAAERLPGTAIEVLHLRHDPMAGFLPTEEVMTEARQRALSGEVAREDATIRAAYETWHRDHPRAVWREASGEAGAVVAAGTAGAGLVVMGRPADGEANGLHAALFRAGAPLLLIPQTTPVSLGRHVAVAWKPGRAARHAVLAALPWLLRAERVQVLIAAEDGVAASPPASLLARLTKARVPAELRRFALSRPVGEALLAEAHRIGADLLVMGAYGRGRMTELLLGGATADLLRAADLPILMRH